MDSDEKKGGMSASSDNLYMSEASADAKALARPGGVSRSVADSELENSRGKFAPVSDRPYHGNLKGRLETRPEGPADLKLQSEAEKLEEATIKTRDSVYSQHGASGFAGNYNVGWEVEA